MPTASRLDPPGPQSIGAVDPTAPLLAEIAASGALPPRIVIEQVRPAVDGGRFAVKRIVGDELDVEADIFRDGSDQIAAALLVQIPGTVEWTRIAMQPLDNDRWIARIRLGQIGRLRFAIEAWTDRFASWRGAAAKTFKAGQTMTMVLAQGRELLAAAISRAVGDDRERLLVIAEGYDKTSDDAARTDLLFSDGVAAAVALVPDRSDRVFQDPPLAVIVEREAARFAAWYEIFPRSQGTLPRRSASFDDCIGRLPAIQALGFDVLYLVPIHPIGTMNRKGRDNSVNAVADDPGSSYAIGNRSGGHTAIDPELGTIDGFRRLVCAAREHGMELAMDLAVQCAPDHPWLQDHPQWFRRQPDGSIKFAENPPKKYEDIVNVDFDQADWMSLWQAIKDVVLFWIAEGVKIFRVDNPHTKPVIFWQWLIAEIQRADPAVLFLAEAFTRPKMMNQLAKSGFSQSYTYFTWRNTKRELIDYMTELTDVEMMGYFRPLFFTNTPDILPSYLQTGGRAAFRIRLVLAATLSPAYGIYNGFELCEAEAVPGTEEYAHSEKYQYKVWDWDRPGHIKADITRLNRLRRASPALQRLDNLRFHEAAHDDVLFYSKITPDRDEAVLVAVTLAPRPVVRTEIVFPLAAMGLSDDVDFETVELFTGERRRWRGARHLIVIDPEVNPAMVLRYQKRPMAGDSTTGGTP
ncbi:MAG: alpha-1,4-glucan--maltose-1-phosphate maltosyltransferase [Azospirillaceae bacterium]|nr:alpha-1,4-glucan--maltose-1-phosphate maltosyltransferase [Azospirillaceae bacterium]